LALIREGEWVLLTFKKTIPIPILIYGI